MSHMLRAMVLRGITQMSVLDLSSGLEQANLTIWN